MFFNVENDLFCITSSFVNMTFEFLRKKNNFG